MRVSIEKDDALMAEAMEALGTKTKKATVAEALRRMIEAKRKADPSARRGDTENADEL